MQDFKFNAFITGSYAYGTPHEGSDIDLVICLDTSTDDNQVLWDHSESQQSCRYGKLNLIVLPPDKFRKWQEVSDELVSRDHNVERDEAVAAFQAAGFTQEDYGTLLPLEEPLELNSIGFPIFGEE